MPVEEDEVRLACTIDHLVDANQPLNRRPAAALFERIEVDDADHLALRRRFRPEWPATYSSVLGVPTIRDLWRPFHRLRFPHLPLPA
jgi:hypothetical protein